MLRKRLFNGIGITLGIIGALFSLWFIMGVAQGVANADETTGGYEYPYTGWEGTPIDFESWYVTNTGLFYAGQVADQLLDCSTGQLVIRVMGIININFRPFSDRAKVVHQPQITCRALGYDTRSWDAINDPDGLFTELMSATSKPE